MITKELILTYLKDNPKLTPIAIAELILKKYSYQGNIDSLRRHVYRIGVKNDLIQKTEPKKQVLSPLLPIIKVEYKNSGDMIVLESRNVKSFDDLLAHANVNLEKYNTDNPFERMDIGDGSIFHIKASFKRKKSFETDFEFLKEDLLKNLKEYTKPLKFVTFPRPKKVKGRMGVINMSDLHAGKYASASETGADYNLEIAIKRFTESFQYHLEIAHEQKVEQLLLPYGNDLLNSDRSNPFPQTTNGTAQTDSAPFEQILTGVRRLLVQSTNAAAKVANVRIIIVRGNHDYERMYALGDTLSGIYENSKQVIVDNGQSSRKYFHYYKTLLGFTHGDKITSKKLLTSMPKEAPELWASSVYREWICGHLHHLKEEKFVLSKDDGGVIIRNMEALCGNDSYHHKAGFIGARIGSTSLFYDRETGLYQINPHNLIIQ